MIEDIDGVDVIDVGESGAIGGGLNDCAVALMVPEI